MNQKAKPQTKITAQTREQLTNAEQTLYCSLLAECKRLRSLMDYDEEGGFYFWPHAEGLAREGFGSQCGICTNGARLIARKFGGVVAGYHFDEHDPETLVGTVAGGHDFAVIRPFIVDWWAWEYEQSLKCPVILRSEGILAGKYKPEAAWSVHPENDFRASAI